MKPILSLLMLLSGTTLLFSGCDTEEPDRTQVTPVTQLYAPDDNAFLNLGAQSSAVFEWAAAKAEDNGVVLYEVVFAPEGGNFDNPTFTVPSDGKGLQRTLTLPFAELNRIAGLAGIAPEATGKLIWTVLSSKGINVQPSMVSRVVEVRRPAGFPPPDELFLTGTATEGGEALAQALTLKKVSPTTFEIYTSLKAGEYAFVTRKEGTPDTYFIENGKLKAEGKTTVAGDERVYRIRLDFATAQTEIAVVESVGLYFSPNDEYLAELPYAGNGTWTKEDLAIAFRQESWGRDERYKFRFMVNSDGVSSEEWYGSTNADNSRPDDNTSGAYWYMVPVTNDRWSNTFKFSTAVDNSVSDVDVVFNATVPAYTHSITPN